MVAPRDVRVLTKKGGWGAGPLTLPGGIGYQYTYLLVLPYASLNWKRQTSSCGSSFTYTHALFRHRLALFAVPPFASAFNRMGPNAARLSSSSAKDVGG